MLKPFAIALLTILFTIASMLLANLGLNWIDLGHGIHPAIAFPLATLAILSAFITPKVW